MLKENFSKNNLLLFMPFIVLFIIVFIMNNEWGYVIDDVFYRKLVLMDGWNQILSTVYYRYLLWTSRSLIELNILVLCYLPMIVWKILNTIIVTLIAYLIPKFFDNEIA